MGQGDLREFLDRFAKHLGLVVLPRRRGLLWRIADPGVLLESCSSSLRDFGSSLA